MESREPPPIQLNVKGTKEREAKQIQLICCGQIRSARCCGRGADSPLNISPGILRFSLAFSQGNA